MRVAFKNTPEACAILRDVSIQPYMVEFISQVGIFIACNDIQNSGRIKLFTTLPNHPTIPAKWYFTLPIEAFNILFDGKDPNDPFDQVSYES